MLSKEHIKATPYNTNPTVEMKEKLTLSRQHEAAFLDFMVEAVPEGRERSLAVTKLQEARMWINEAISKFG